MSDAYHDCIHDPAFRSAGRYQPIAEAYRRATGREPAATDIGHGYYRMHYEHRSLAALEADWRAAGRPPTPDPPDLLPSPDYPRTLAEAVGMVVGYGPVVDGRIPSWFAPGRIWLQWDEAEQREYARWLRSQGLNTMWLQASTWNRPIMGEILADSLADGNREKVNQTLQILASEGVSVILETMTVERAIAFQGSPETVHIEMQRVAETFGAHPNILAIMPTREVEKLTFPSLSPDDRVTRGIGGCFRAVKDGWGSDRNGRPILYHGRSWAVPASGMMAGMDGVVWGVHTKLTQDDRQPVSGKDDQGRERTWPHAAAWLDDWDTNRRRYPWYDGYCLFETVLPPDHQVPGHRWGDGYTMAEAAELGTWYRETLTTAPICDLSMGTKET